MSQRRLPPPPPELCLTKPYPSSQKGGTLIASEIADLETHKRLLCDPDGYRPPSCPRCDHEKLHVHDYRERILRAQSDMPKTDVVRYRCASEDCGATWQVLPMVIARHLHRTWCVVEAATLGPRTSTQPRVPPRTARRWSARLVSAARMLVSLLAICREPAVEEMAREVGLDATREELVVACGAGLGTLAALVHTLEPGVRLM